MRGYIESGKLRGRRARDRRRPSASGDGYFVEPTLFSATSDDLTIAREEIFGPVLVALPYDSIEEVARRANDTEYGLAAGVWTRDLAQGAQARRAAAGRRHLGQHLERGRPVGPVRRLQGLRRGPRARPRGPGRLPREQDRLGQPQLKRSGLEGREVELRPLAADVLGHEPAADRAVRHAGALVAGGHPEPVGRLPSARSPAGRRAARGAGRPRRRPPRAARTPGAKRAAALSSAADTSRSTDRSKPRRSRLEPTSTWPSSVVSSTVLTCSPSAGSLDRVHVAAVDHLVAQEVGPALEPHELALARLDGQPQPGAGGRARRSKCPRRAPRRSAGHARLPAHGCHSLHATAAPPRSTRPRAR